VPAQQVLHVGGRFCAHIKAPSFLFLAIMRGTGLPQLPSAVTSTIDHPLGSPSFLTRLCMAARHRFLPPAQRGDQHRRPSYRISFSKLIDAVLRCSDRGLVCLRRRTLALCLARAFGARLRARPGAGGAALGPAGLRPPPLLARWASAPRWASAAAIPHALTLFS
jgi:hypothetical protein